MGVATGCGCKEVYRIPHTIYLSLLLLYLFFFAAASLLFSQIVPRVCTLVLFINPRRACARVTVLVLSVCVFSLFWHLAQSGVQTAVSATSVRYGHEI